MRRRAARRGSALADHRHVERHADQEEDREQHEGEQGVHDHARAVDEEALLDALREQVVGRARRLLRLRSGHLHEAADREQRDLVERVTAAERDDRRAEAEREDLRPHAAPARREEVTVRRFVGAHLLGRDHQLEIDGEVLPRLGDQIVVHVREDPEPDPGTGEPLERTVRIAKRLPGRQRGREFASCRLAHLDPFGRCRPPGRLREDLAIGPELLGLDVRLDLGVAGQQPRSLDLAARGVGERRRDPRLPVDQCSVTVKGDDVDDHRYSITFRAPGQFSATEMLTGQYSA